LSLVTSRLSLNFRNLDVQRTACLLDVLCVCEQKENTFNLLFKKTVNRDMTLSVEYKIEVRGKEKWRSALFPLPSLENE